MEHPQKLIVEYPPPKKKKNFSHRTSKKLLPEYLQKIARGLPPKIAPGVPLQNCSQSTPRKLLLEYPPPQKKQKKTTLRAVLSEPTPCPALPSLTVLSLYLPLPEPCHCTLPILPCPSHYTAPQPRFKFPSLYCCWCCHEPATQASSRCVCSGKFGLVLVC